ncbi:MAG: hypothetical protein ACREM1_19090, partial [Longimicrobiales bacterium]
MMRIEFEARNRGTTFPQLFGGRRGTGPTRRVFIAIASIALVLPGCDSLLEVEIPGRVEEGALGDPALATTLVNSALG